MAAKDLTIYQPDAQVGELKLWRPPDDVLREAQQAAVALQKRIAGKAKPVIFNGEQYIESDDWQMLGNFFGYAAKVESTEFVCYGDTEGFKAVAVLLNEHTGAVVGRAEAICLDEEENWGERSKYEWQNKLGEDAKPIWDPKAKDGKGAYLREKVEVGSVAVPLFQLMSMAETRACNKVFRNKLAWVVTLAGYKPTPAEELPKNDTKPEAAETQEPLPTEIKKKEPLTPQTVASASAASNSRPSQPMSSAKVGTGAGVTADAPVPFSRPPIQSPKPPQVRTISEPQARRFYAIRKSTGREDEETTAFLQENFGIDDDRKIPADRYEFACRWASGENV